MQNDVRYCRRCGAQLIRATDEFCVRCGERQSPPVTLITPQRPSKPSFWVSFFKGIAYVALFFGIQLLVTFVGEIVIISKLGIGSSSTDLVTSVYSEIGKWSWLFCIIEAILLFLILGVFFAVRHKKLTREIKMKRMSPAAVGGCAVCGVGAQFAAVIFLTLLYAFMPFLASFSVSDDLANMMSAPSPALDFLYIAILTPLMEEVVFRGLVYTRLRRSLNAGAAIVLCGIIFGAAHMNIEQFLYAAPLGMLMAAVFEKYGSLLAPFAIHFAFNGGNYLAGYLPEKPEMLVPALAVIGTGFMLISVAFIFCTAKNTSPEIERNSTNEAL